MWWVKSYYYKLCRTQKVLSEYDICLAIRGICKALLPRCCQLLTRFFSYIFSDIISVLRGYLVKCKLHLRYPIFFIFLYRSSFWFGIYHGMWTFQFAANDTSYDSSSWDEYESAKIRARSLLRITATPTRIFWWIFSAILMDILWENIRKYSVLLVDETHENIH